MADLDQVQWGGTMDLSSLPDVKKKKIIKRMREAGIRVGNVAGEEQYIINIDL